MASGRWAWRGVLGSALMMSFIMLVTVVLGGIGPATDAAADSRESSVTDRALNVASTSDAAVVVEELTSETRLVRALPSGDLRAEVAPVPVRVEQADGSWAAVDLSLETRSDGWITPAMAPVDVRFSGGGDTRLAVLSYEPEFGAEGDAASLMVSWPGGAA